jgi:hypothetical protein
VKIPAEVRTERTVFLPRPPQQPEQQDDILSLIESVHERVQTVLGPSSLIRASTGPDKTARPVSNRLEYQQQFLDRVPDLSDLPISQYR